MSFRKSKNGHVKRTKSVNDKKDSFIKVAQYMLYAILYGGFKRQL